MAKLEAIEWTNMWLDHPEDKDKKRVLLIGDSITQGMKDEVKKAVGEDILVDALTTSRAPDNESLLTEIFYVLNMAEYDIIHFSNGLHGMYQPIDDYELTYSRVLEKIMEKAPKARIILALSTPITLPEDSLKFNEERNGIVLERNKAVERIAEKYGLEINDNYSEVAGKTGIGAGDGVHYNAEGYRLLGNRVGKLLK